ncbi:MAG: hypothetical protein GY858_02640 [Candidatus Omnitrophica bacterium]|nr:hypothetical protein [Candidatus Omnitrophota bacterium]
MKKGIALVLALFSMVFMALLVVAFLDIATIDYQIVTNHIRGLQAEFIADAGVETGIYELRQDDEYSGSSGDVVFPSGSGNTYNVTVDGDEIVSVGTVDGFSRTITVDFTLSGASAPHTVTINTWE